MPEYIEREAVKKALAYSGLIPKNYADGKPITDKVIDRIPAVDVVPVVRCRKCKHGKCGIDNMVKCNHPCGKVIYTKSQDFCSYGERRNDNV